MPEKDKELVFFCRSSLYQFWFYTKGIEYKVKKTVCLAVVKSRKKRFFLLICGDYWIKCFSSCNICTNVAFYILPT